jgi:hypothetical protein
MGFYAYETLTGNPKGKYKLLRLDAAAIILFIYALIGETFSGS